MKYWILIWTFLATGCATVQPGAQVLSGPPSTQDAAPGGLATIRWVVSDTPTEDCNLLSRSKKMVFTSRGCSSWSDRQAVRECSIIAPMPRHERDFERIATLGHEFWHCIHGRWHDDYGNAYPVASRKSATQ